MRRRQLPRMVCRNPRCAEFFQGDDWWTWRTGLCPACRSMGRWGMFLGGLLAGAIAWVLR